MSETEKEVARLLNIVLDLATNENAPVRDMSAMSLIVSALQTAVETRRTPDELLATLVGALAWIARDHWPEVSAAIREIEGSRLQ